MIVAPALFPVAAIFKSSAKKHEPDEWARDNDSDIAREPRNWRKTMGRAGFQIWKVVYVTVIMIAGHYVWMRLMLLSLALAALRRIEPGTYTTVKWAQFLPSFS